MKQITKKVSVNLTSPDGQAKEFEKPVTFPEYENASDVLEALSGDPADKAVKERIDEILAALNYGVNLKARAAVTAQIKNENQGPGVAIDRTVKQLIANYAKGGRVITPEAARAKVMANLEDFGIFLDKLPESTDAATEEKKIEESTAKA